MDLKPREIELRLRVLPHQVIPAGDWSVALFTGGRGIGKTAVAARWILQRALQYPNTRHAAVGRTWAETYRILATGPSGLRALLIGDDTNPDPARRRPNIEVVLQGGKWEKAFSGSPGRMELRFSNGSVILFASADNPNSLRGLSVSSAVCDEAAFWDEESAAMIRYAVRESPAPGEPARMLITTTPNGVSCWVYRDYVRNAPQAGVVWVGGDDAGRLPRAKAASTLENPFLDAAFREGIFRDYAGTTLGRQELYGEWLSPVGGIYELSPVTHTRTGLEAAGEAWPRDRSEVDEVVAGLDLGTVAASALTVLARRADRWYVVGEAYGPCATADALSEMIAPLVDRWQPRVIVTDTNFPMTSNQLRRGGLPIHDADKRPGSVADGIRAVQQLFASGMLAVDEQACPNTWRDLSSYRWATDAHGVSLDRPDKVNDHACDALRYVVAYATGRRRLLFS